MGILDKKIQRTTNFKQVIESIVQRMFSVVTDTKRIYVDLNSCISILFRYEDVNNPEVAKMVSDSMEQFLTKYLESKTQIIVLFTLDKSAAHLKIYPDWCKTRYERVNIAESGFLRALLVSLGEFSKNNPLVKISNTHKVHPALVVYKNELGKRDKYTVLSKDVVFQCVPDKQMIIFNGVNLIDMEDEPRMLPDDVTLTDPDFMLPYYLAIKGDVRNEFKGVEGYAKRKASKYCESNRISIKVGANHPLKEECDKYVQLYDIKKLLENNTEEIKLII